MRDGTPAAARAATLRRHPDLRTALMELGGRITERQMRRMNLAAEAEHRSPHAIALEFLRTEGLVGPEVK